MINAPSELYNKPLNMYPTQYDDFSIAQKKKINILNKPKNLNLELYSDEDELSPLENDDDEVKSEPEKTIAERVKLNPRKRGKKEEQGQKF